MDADERPVLRCFVSFPIQPDPDWWTDPALVSLELALELKRRGYLVIGPDPEDEQMLAAYERIQRAVERQRKKKWFEIPD